MLPHSPGRQTCLELAIGIHREQSILSSLAGQESASNAALTSRQVLAVKRVTDRQNTGNSHLAVLRRNSA